MNVVEVCASIDGVRLQQTIIVGQLVISEKHWLLSLLIALKEGAKRALLPVGGAFHSP
jgi:hypothetical protein